MRYLKTIMRSHLGVSRLEIGLSIAKPLHREPRSISCDISKPLEAIRADKLDLYPLMVVVDSPFSKR